MRFNPFESVSVRTKIIAGGLGAALLSGCANSADTGNGFDVKGHVDHGGKQSVTAKIYDVVYAQGDAKDWFSDMGTHQLHDNCDCGSGWWNDNIKVGHVLDMAGVVIEPSALPSGSCVDFQGSIREILEGKFIEERPVYTLAKEIPCSN